MSFGRLVISCLSLVQLILTGFCFGQLPSSTEQTIATANVVDFCLNESFNVTCDLGHVILVDSAQFGRMRPGRCIAGEFNIGCAKDVKQFFDNQCNIRPSCDVSVRSLVDFHPCQRDFVSYLEIGYQCVQVEGLLESDCPPDGTQRLSRISGYLIRSPHHSVGSDRCPWTLTVDPGQRLNLSIIHVTSASSASDFDLPLFSSLSDSVRQSFRASDSSSSSSSSSSSTSCSTNVVVDDVIAAKRIQVGVCAVDRRLQRHLMTSTGNAVSVHVTGNVGVDGADFLLRYSAVGCPKFHPPSHSWAKIIGEGGGGVMIRCNDTQETWYLTCHGNRWHGDVGNCSKSRLQAEPEGSGKETKRFVFNSVWVAVVMGIVLGGFLGLAMLATVFLARRRSMNSSVNATTSLMLTSNNKKPDGGHPTSHESNALKNPKDERCSQAPLDLETRLVCGTECLSCSKPFTSVVIPRHQTTQAPCHSFHRNLTSDARTLRCTHRPDLKTVVLQATPPSRVCRVWCPALAENETRLSVDTVDLLRVCDGHDRCTSDRVASASFRPGMRSSPGGGGKTNGMGHAIRAEAV